VTEDTLPVIEPLYYSASYDRATGDTIVKVVNVQDISVNVDVVLEDLQKPLLIIEVHEMSGHSLNDENTFEAPDRVSPKQSHIHAQGNRFAYSFPKHSITVFRVK
jgi:alpha-L-arabinofuranosidase